MFHPPVSKTALKEWAPTINALGNGDQMIIVREIDLLKNSHPAHREFFFYPDLPDRNPEHLRPEFQKHLRKAIDEDDTPGLVFLNLWGEITSIFSLEDAKALDALSPHHIWGKEYVQERIPKKALVALVRVYHLIQPQALPVMDEYTDCKTWVELVEDIPLGEIRPILAQQEYDKRAKAVEQALGNLRAQRLPQ